MKTRNLLITAFLLFFYLYNNAQIYTWMKASGVNQSGIYGTMGLPAASNKPGGRELSANWTDNAGNFWIFGGFGCSAGSSYELLNDLWKYNPATSEWTWMSGTNLDTQPGVYGTIGVASVSNKPGARHGAVTWTDASGNLWLFGGNGVATGTLVGLLNDMWKYNTTTNQWTWVSGGNTVMQSGNYGQQGVSAASNIPGGRFKSTYWKDAPGNLWVFGGFGSDGNGVPGSLNDLWKYDMATNQWTWVSGTNSLGQNGVYGTQGVASTTNIPGGRNFGEGWRDAAGNLWLFGGSGYDATNSNEDILNDVWKYNIAANEWTWMGGSDMSAQAGVYGTLGVAAAGNIPGARTGSTVWTDALGNVFLFGGYISGLTVANPHTVDDMWKYNMATNQWTWIAGSNSGFQQTGVYGTQGVPAATNKPGVRCNALGWVDSSNQLWFFGGYGFGLTNQGTLCDMWMFSNCSSFPTVSISSSNSLICVGNVAVLTASGAASYSWGTGSTYTTSTISVAPLFTSTYAVTGADANGCKTTAFFTQNVVTCSGINEINETLHYAIHPNPNTGNFTITGKDFSASTKLFIFNALGQKVFEDNLSSENIQTQLQKGIYYYTVMHNTKTVSSGKIMIE